MEKEKINTVVIVRDFPEQLTGGSCCGRLDRNRYSDSDDPFVRLRNINETCGIVHRILREHYQPDRVRIFQIDPRNQLSLFILLVRQVFYYRIGFVSALKTALMFFSLPAFIVNGKVLISGNQLKNRDVVTLVENELA